ncbi:MAG: hypothetical protein HY926_08020 [Elusimicrobia bacterium]|nr:hypothetical protein [Elusimicrobiota bacterium]
MLRMILPLLAVAALCGCGILYTNVHNARSYRSATPNEVKASPTDETVSGMGCNKSLLYLVAWGDGGYIAAVKNALGPRDGILYDVKCDIKVNSVLVGLYSKVCTKVTGRVAKL